MIPQSQLVPAGASPDSDSGSPYELAIVVPTLNEAQNIERIVASIDAALPDVRYELLFVDDWSGDGTADRIADMARDRPNVRVLRRWGRRGLSSAVIEGMMATMAPVVAVMDGDGQHDEQLLPRLYQLVADDRADIAIGSRYAPDGSIGDWSALRHGASRLATRLSTAALRQQIGDPMSGFFAVRRKLVEELLPGVSGRGFKILFDLISASPRPLAIAEVPYRFRLRTEGESKLGANVLFDYAMLLLNRSIRSSARPRFIAFAFIGALGLGVHLAILRFAMFDGVGFSDAQIIAVVSAIAFNFFGNNNLTFRDRRLRGESLIGGLLKFYAVCGLGAMANIGTGIALFAEHHRWWISAIAGAVVGSLWNFMAAELAIWRKR